MSTGKPRSLLPDSSERLQEIMQRWQAASYEPWTAELTVNDGYVVRGPPIAPGGNILRRADAEFVAAAHQDIPFLLDMIANTSARYAMSQEARQITLEQNQQLIELLLEALRLTEPDSPAHQFLDQAIFGNKEAEWSQTT